MNMTDKKYIKILLISLAAALCMSGCNADNTSLKTEETEAGTLQTYHVSGVEKDKVLLTLPTTRYIPKEVSP